jgi:mercuric ion transport protein
MSDSNSLQRGAKETWVGWSAIATAALAMFAWASCCVLPITLSLAGLSLAGTGFIAGQRTWITLLALALVSGGWFLVIRKARRCRVDNQCSAPSRASVWLLAAATILILLSLIWTPVIEPAALRALVGFRR